MNFLNILQGITLIYHSCYIYGFENMLSSIVYLYNVVVNLMLFSVCCSRGVEVDLVLRNHRLGSMIPLGKRASYNLGLDRRTYASGNCEEMDIQSRETRESI